MTLAEIRTRRKEIKEISLFYSHGWKQKHSFLAICPIFSRSSLADLPLPLYRQSSYFTERSRRNLVIAVCCDYGHKNTSVSIKLISKEAMYLARDIKSIMGLLINEAVEDLGWEQSEENEHAPRSVK